MNSSGIDFNVAQIEFVVAVLSTASIFFLLRPLKLRQCFLAAANFLVVWLLTPNLQSLIALAVFLGSGFLVALFLKRGFSRAILGIYLVLLVIAFLVLKQYDILCWVLPEKIANGPIHFPAFDLPEGLLHHSVRIAGLSYMLFRQIHFLVDVDQGQIEVLSLWTYLNYQLNVFAILAGPIQRYEDFSEQWQRLCPVLAGPTELMLNCLRLLWGVIKAVFLAPYFLNGVTTLRGPIIAAHVAGWKLGVEFLIVLYFFPVYLYLNFSGYCDIVIAASNLFGVRLPENFDRPYVARNVLDFWNRWHITLGTWIRDYMFLTLYKPIVEHSIEWAAWLVYPCYIIAFTVAGVWHGSSLSFLIFGLLQGIGACAAKWWEKQILKRGGRPALRAYLESRKIRALAILLHFHFQCFAMLFFATKFDDTVELLKNLSNIFPRF